MSNQQKIPIITCFDVEPDLRLIQREKKEPWLGYEQIQPILEELRSRLAEATQSSVHYSWYFRLDQQIETVYGSAAWPLEKYENLVRQSEKARDEMGIHPHTYRWDEARNNWVAVHDEIDYGFAAIELSLSTYQSFFHHPCRSLRMGDRWIRDETIGFLEKHGIQYDLTLEPGQKSQPHVVRNELHTGSIPSFAGIPQKPYRPHKNCFSRPDPLRQDGLWMIPLSSEKIGGIKGALQRFNRQVVRGKRHEQEYLTLNFEMKPWIFRSIAEQLLKKIKPSYLAIVSRTSVAIDNRRNFLANWDYFLHHPLRARFVFSRPDEAMQIFAGQAWVQAGSQNYS